MKRRIQRDSKHKGMLKIGTLLDALQNNADYDYSKLRAIHIFKNQNGEKIVVSTAQKSKKK